MLVETPVRAIDLVGRIRQILADTDLSDPEVITEQLIADLPYDMLREVLRSVLPSYVRQRIAAERVFTTPAAAQKVLIRSSKVTGITEWWRAALEDRVLTGVGRKRLADCTSDDLEHIATELRSKARRFAEKAERYERLRAKVVEEGCAVVGGLSVSTLRDLLGTFPDGSTAVPDEL
jgi:hypothetical protein